MPKATIMVGIPGSGKSTWVAKHRPNAVVFSADSLFMTSAGEYEFDRSQLPAAHASCLRGFARHIQTAELDCVVDNTNVTLDQIAPYIALASAFAWDVEVIVLLNRHIEDCVVQNVHGVPRRSIEHMAKCQARLLMYWPDRWPKPEFPDV